jgi:hypothetical protein
MAGDLELPFGIKVTNPVPLIEIEGPYPSIDAACAGVDIALRFPTLQVRIVPGDGSAPYFAQWGLDLSDGGLAKVSSGGLNTPIQVTFSQLQALIGAETLIPGQMYCVTDYSTTYIQGLTNELKFSEQEPIYITAISSSVLSQNAQSATWPADKIVWDYTQTIIPTGFYVQASDGVAAVPATDIPTTGIITRRIDERGNSMPWDLRQVLAAAVNVPAIPAGPGKSQYSAQIVTSIGELIPSIPGQYTVKLDTTALTGDYTGSQDYLQIEVWTGQAALWAPNQSIVETEQYGVNENVTIDGALQNIWPVGAVQSDPMTTNIKVKVNGINYQFVDRFGTLQKISDGTQIDYSEINNGTPYYEGVTTNYLIQLWDTAEPDAYDLPPGTPAFVGNDIDYFIINVLGADDTVESPLFSTQVRFGEVSIDLDYDEFDPSLGPFSAVLTTNFEYSGPGFNVMANGNIHRVSSMSIGDALTLIDNIAANIQIIVAGDTAGVVGLKVDDSQVLGNYSWDGTPNDPGNYWNLVVVDEDNIQWFNDGKQNGQSGNIQNWPLIYLDKTKTWSVYLGLKLSGSAQLSIKVNNQTQVFQNFDNSTDFNSEYPAFPESARIFTGTLQNMVLQLWDSFGTEPEALEIPDMTAAGPTDYIEYVELPDWTSGTPAIPGTYFDQAPISSDLGTVDNFVEDQMTRSFIVGAGASGNRAMAGSDGIAIGINSSRNKTINAVGVDIGGGSNDNTVNGTDAYGNIITNISIQVACQKNLICAANTVLQSGSNNNIVGNGASGCNLGPATTNSTFMSPGASTNGDTDDNHIGLGAPGVYIGGFCNRNRVEYATNVHIDFVCEDNIIAGFTTSPIDSVVFTTGEARNNRIYSSNTTLNYGAEKNYVFEGCNNITIGGGFGNIYHPGCHDLGTVDPAGSNNGNTYMGGCYNITDNGSRGNFYGTGCHDITLGISSNDYYFGDGCFNITDGGSTQLNVFGIGCHDITLNMGGGSSRNRFGNGVYNITDWGNTDNFYGDGCHDINMQVIGVSGNVFGANCSNIIKPGSNNFFGAGTNTLDLGFGFVNNCRFGANCYNINNQGNSGNVFGDNCTNITLDPVGQSTGNTFKDGCQNITLLGAWTGNVFGKNNSGHVIGATGADAGSGNTFEDGCQNISITGLAGGNKFMGNNTGLILGGPTGRLDNNTFEVGATNITLLQNSVGNYFDYRTSGVTLLGDNFSFNRLVNVTNTTYAGNNYRNVEIDVDSSARPDSYSDNGQLLTQQSLILQDSTNVKWKISVGTDGSISAALA